MLRRQKHFLSQSTTSLRVHPSSSAGADCSLFGRGPESPENVSCSRQSPHFGVGWTGSPWFVSISPFSSDLFRIAIFVFGNAPLVIECFRGRHRGGRNFTSFLRFSGPFFSCSRMSLFYHKTCTPVEATPWSTAWISSNLFRFAPIWFQNKSEQVRKTPFLPSPVASPRSRGVERGDITVWPEILHYSNYFPGIAICPKTITLQHVIFGQLISGAVT